MKRVPYNRGQNGKCEIMEVAGGLVCVDCGHSTRVDVSDNEKMPPVVKPTLIYFGA
jgi:hypothetical protein